MTEMLEATYGLSPVQQGMLFHHLSHPHSGVDIEQIVASLEEDIDPTALRGAWQRVAERHAVLRTSFRWENVDEPVQEVHRHIELPIEIEDWRSVPASEHGGRLAERLRADRERGFDLREASATPDGPRSRTLATFRPPLSPEPRRPGSLSPASRASAGCWRTPRW